MWLLNEIKNRKDCHDIAVIHRDDSLTYSDLWDHAGRIASWISEKADTKAPVLIYGNKDIRIVEVMIASLMTGRAYVPIDVTFPKERVEQIAKITKAEIIVNLSGVYADFSLVAHCADIAAVDGICSSYPFSDHEDDWVQGDDNCYILFTSGSTGEPKGVQISKNNIINFVDWFAKTADTKGSTVLNQVSYSFDVSVIQLYIYLPMGKTLFCIDKEMIADFGSLFEHLSSSGIASWVSTPAFIEMCAVYESFSSALLPNLEKIILAGEVLTKKLVRTLWDKFPGVEVINGYGPTEGTVLLTCCTINDRMVSDNDNELPIGYILDNAEYNIDTSVRMEDTPKSGETAKRGELVVKSASISKGYFNNPEATAKSFFKDDEDRFMSYRTGDIVYEIGDLIYYCGRKDFQIKLNGYRIELDDISENINRIDEVSNNVVLPVYRDGRVSHLIAFIVLKNDLGMSAAKTSVYLRKELGKLIPSYMIPKKMVILDSFPLNVNGKIDRKALMEKYS